MTEYIWKCNKCPSTLKINYDASVTDYIRFKDCICKEKGLYEWQYNIHSDDNDQ